MQKKTVKKVAKKAAKKEVLFKLNVRISNKEKVELKKLAKKLKVSEQSVKRAALQEYLSNNR